MTTYGGFGIMGHLSPFVCAGQSRLGESVKRNQFGVYPAGPAGISTPERKVGERSSLASADKELKRKIETDGGAGALFGASERVRSQRGVRERFLRGLENSGAYDAKFREVFRRHRLPEDLAYLPHVESSFQLNARSGAGASGMWQFMRSTGRQYMTVGGSVDERLDPVAVADAAARYLKTSHLSLRSWSLALTSYNHGLGGMKKAQARYGDDIARIAADYDGRYFGFASRNFYAEYLAARHVARNADRYFPEGVRYRPALSDQPVVLRDAVTVDDIARHYRVPRSVLIERNYAWLEPVRNGSRPVPAGTTVWLPQGMTWLASGQPRSSAFQVGPMVGSTRSVGVPAVDRNLTAANALPHN